MGRHKKNNSIQQEEKPIKDEAPMTITTEDAGNNVDILENIEQEIDLKRQELEKLKLDIEEKKIESQKTPVTCREVDADEMVLIKKQISGNVKNSALKEKIEKQKAYDSVMVTGKFINRRAPGQPVKLPYVKYESDPVKWYPFKDGGVYTIPRGFADQINGGDETNPCYYTPRFTQKQGEQVMSSETGENSAISSVDCSNKKYAFVQVGF